MHCITIIKTRLIRNKRVVNIKKRLSIEKEAMDLIQVADNKMNGVSPDYTSAKLNIKMQENKKLQLKSN